MRKINSIRNFLSVALPFFVIGILGFIRVRFFLNALGEEVSSLNQLFNNLLAYLALAEGGVGLFVVQKYYKCFVDNDKKKINEIFKASTVYFHRIALIIVLSGIVLSFFLNILTNNNLSLGYMQIAFIIFLFRYAIEYWFYAPRFVIQADQKLYKINYFLNLIRILEILAEIILLKYVPNYFIILIPGLVIRLIGYPLINKVVYKLYPYLREKANYKKDTLKGFHNIISQKVSGLVFENTDVIIVSSFLTPFSVIVYTSYNYISKYLNDFTYLISSSAMSSVGNSLYKETKEANYIMFKKFNVLFIFIASIFVCCFIILINPFVGIWVGNKYIVSNITVYLFALVLFINIIKKPISVVKDDLGLFKETKWIILLEAILNVVISLLLVKKYMINGILLGTIISSLLTTFWYLPNYIYKHYFNKNSSYYYLPFVFSIVIISICLIVSSIINMQMNSLILFLVYAFGIFIIISTILFFIYYCCFSSFRLLINDIKSLFGGKHEKSIK